MRELSEQELLATMDEPRPVDLADAPPFDFWPYVDALPAEVDGRPFDRERVARSWVMRSGRWQHLLLGTDDPDVFVVVVLDLPSSSVLGHRLLDLRALYGLDGEPAR